QPPAAQRRWRQRTQPPAAARWRWRQRPQPPTSTRRRGRWPHATRRARRIGWHPAAVRTVPADPGRRWQGRRQGWRPLGESRAAGAGADGGAGSGAGGVPFFPPMAGGVGGAGDKPKERERQTWLSEDESVWGTGEEAGIAVVGWPGGEQPYDEEPLPPSRPVR